MALNPAAPQPPPPLPDGYLPTGLSLQGDDARSAVTASPRPSLVAPLLVPPSAGQILGGGYEVNPAVVSEGARQILQAITDLPGEIQRFLADARLSVDDFGNLERSEEAAIKYTEALGELKVALTQINEMLRSKGEALRQTADNYANCEQHNTC